MQSGDLPHACRIGHEAPHPETRKGLRPLTCAHNFPAVRLEHTFESTQSGGRRGSSSDPANNAACRPVRREVGSRRRRSRRAIRWSCSNRPPPDTRGEWRSGPQLRAGPRASVLVLQETAVALQVERPAVGRRDAVAQTLPAVTVAVEVAMLELDPRALGSLGDDAGPFALAAVRAAVVDPAAGARLEDRRFDVDAEHVVLSRLDLVHLLGEHAERALDRRLDDDLLANRRRLGLRGHATSSLSCSTTSLKVASAWLQNRSSCERKAATPSGSA